MPEFQHTIAKIESTHLGYEDHGIFSIAVTFSYGGSGQGFGPLRFGDGKVVKAICDAAGVRQWEDLSGRTVYAVREPGYDGLVKGIAPLPTEKGTGFYLSDDGVVHEYVPKE